ncbi:MAG TPA: porin [Opitutaceae bacterium]|jgi:hypothetical protein|nr:porin [Opitutaceae bacterium]
MFNRFTAKCLALIGGAALTASVALAQDNKALLDALVKKGILTDDEAKQIAADVAQSENKTDVATSGGKFLQKVIISGRIQSQFADIGTSINGAPKVPATQHFLMRRVYLGAKADLGDGFSGTFNYDFANGSLDAAFISWKQSDALAVDVGFRKVPFAYEEYTSSASLNAIERSPATRYFVETNNGRRLGAGSYREGVFVGGTQQGVFYNVAVTNPERDEFSSISINSSHANASNPANNGGVQGSGDSTNNNFAYWGNLGYGGKFDGGTYKAGIEAGYLADQGGTSNTALGTGHNLTVYGVLADVTYQDFNLQGEYLWGDDQQGSANRSTPTTFKDADPNGFWIQPAYKFGDLQAVVRYSYINSDGRGINVSDGTRSAPSGGTMDKMSEWYVGGNWYIRGNDLKLQLGYIHAESKDSVTGASGPKATADGVRSQLQLNF